MDTVPQKFTSNGYDYVQVRRDGKRAIFEQRRKGTVIAWEVVEIKQLPATTIFGKAYPEREGYPSNEDWGTLAWSCSTLERALERYNNLEAA